MPSSLGPAEILVILLVALIVLGPSRLPQAGRQVGKALAEVRRWSNTFQSEIRDVIDPDSDPPVASTPPTTTSTLADSTAADVPAADVPAAGPVSSGPVTPFAAAIFPAATAAPAEPTRSPSPPFPAELAGPLGAPAPSANGSSDGPAEGTPDRPAGGPPAP